MESLLEKLVRNTGPKMSIPLLISSKTNPIKTKFSPLLELDKTKKYEMALVNLETYYSFPNIDSANNNFKYSHDNGITWFNINIPEGCYEFTSINKYIQRIMKDNGHYDSAGDSYSITLEPNRNTLKAVMNIRPNFKVDFTTPNSIRTVLGFDSQVFSEGHNESDNIVNIMSVNSLRVTSDIIGSSYTNGGTENIIYSFFPNVGPGYKIVQKPVNLIYLPITLSTISQMETKLIDQNGELIDNRGEKIAIRLHIKEA